MSLVAERIRAAYSTLQRAERRLVSLILTRYPSASHSDSQVAAFALVEATIIGVVNTLGDQTTVQVSDYNTHWAAQDLANSGIED